jgi:hypothetical protein
MKSFIGSVLEELFHGNICPNVRSYSQDSDFAKVLRLRNDLKEELMAVLNDSEKNLFKKYCAAAEEIDIITYHDLFVYTLKFGVMFMAEIFTNKSEWA